MSADASFYRVNYAIALTDSRIKSALNKVIEKLARSLPHASRRGLFLTPVICFTLVYWRPNLK